MIALAGMIGTGLFLSSGKALAQAGPLGCVSGFITVSFSNIQEASYMRIHRIKDGHGYSFNWHVIHRNTSTPKTADSSLTAYIAAEMSAFKPVEGGFVRHANMWLDESSGITIGYACVVSIYLQLLLMFS